MCELLIASLNHFIITQLGFFFVSCFLTVDDAGLCSDVNEPAAAAAVAPSSEWAIVESSSPPASLAGTYVADADFDVMPTEVRVAAGTTAYLSCRPRSLRNKTVIFWFCRVLPFKFISISLEFEHITYTNRITAAMLHNLTQSWRTHECGQHCVY